MADPSSAAAVAYVLPWWMQWAQAIGIGVISVAGVFIAYKQSRIATAKLNLDLYDRRFKVFDAARTFANVGLWDAEITQEAINAYHAGTTDAVFLFNEEMERYLDEFGKKVFQLRMLKTQLDGAMMQELRVKIGDELASHGRLVLAEMNVLVEKFKPFLKLGNI